MRYRDSNAPGFIIPMQVPHVAMWVGNLWSIERGISRGKVMLPSNYFVQIIQVLATCMWEACCLTGEGSMGQW